jgi:hypothetical protein
MLAERVSTVERDETLIREHLRNQESEGETVTFGWLSEPLSSVPRIWRFEPLPLRNRLFRWIAGLDSVGAQGWIESKARRATTGPTAPIAAHRRRWAAPAIQPARPGAEADSLYAARRTCDRLDDMTTEPANNGVSQERIPTARVVLFTLITGYLLAGPIYIQGLHGRSVALIPWNMFRSVGPACRAEFRERKSPAEEQRLDRFRELGYWRDAELTSSRRAPNDVRVILNESQALTVARRLCAARPRADVRVYLSCADDHGGWATVLQGERNACEATSSERSQ